MPKEIAEKNNNHPEFLTKDINQSVSIGQTQTVAKECLLLFSIGQTRTSREKSGLVSVSPLQNKSSIGQTQTVAKECLLLFSIGQTQTLREKSGLVSVSPLQNKSSIGQTQTATEGQRISLHLKTRKTLILLNKGHQSIVNLVINQEFGAVL